MTQLSSTAFFKTTNSLLTQSVREYTKKQKLEIKDRLLGKFLIENASRFTRCVTQSEDGHYYNLYYEIGVVAGRRLFFAITNRLVYAVALFAENSTKTGFAVPQVASLEPTNRLINQVVGYLETRKVNKKKTGQIIVPTGFYVFEFLGKKQDGTWEETAINPSPYKARSMREAIKLFQNDDFAPRGKHRRLFRVCTKSGWQKLNVRFPSHIPEDYTEISDLKISLAK